jgi:hypothetical protein
LSNTSLAESALEAMRTQASTDLCASFKLACERLRAFLQELLATYIDLTKQQITSLDYLINGEGQKHQQG